MSVTPIPDIEAFLVAYLKRSLPGTKVATENPDKLAEPWIRITLLDPRDVTGVNIDYLIDYMVQFDCFAGNLGTAAQGSGLALTTRAHLLAMEGAHPELVVSKVEFLSGPRHAPDDTSVEPAIPRYELTASITAHAVRS